MAGQTVVVEMGDEDLIPAWQTVIELSRMKATSNWTLIGGLMVYVHARRARLQSVRPTGDVDLLVDYLSDRSSLTKARTDLLKVGFELAAEQKTAYRFQHPDGRQVDVMVADHLPSRIAPPRISRRPAFEAPAGEQAIRRRDNYTLRFTTAGVHVGVPDEIGALVAKGAAYTVDTRDRGRHLSDGATVFASITDASALDYSRVSPNDRKRVRALHEQLSDVTHPAWVGLDQDERRTGQQNMTLVCRTMGVSD